MAIRGENKIVKINLYQTDGTTPLLLSSLDSIVAKVVQSGSTYATYTYGTDPEIRQGDSTSQLEIEVKTSVSTKFRIGIVYIQIEITKTDSEFEVDDTQKDIQKIEAFEIDGL